MQLETYKLKMLKEIVILCFVISGCVSVMSDDYLGRSQDDDNKTLTIRSYFINSVVQNHFATVKYTMKVVNEHNETTNSTFVVPIPEKTFISNLSLVMDGVTYLGETVLNANISENEATNNASNLTELSTHVRYNYIDSMKNQARNIFEIDLTLAAGKEASLTVTYYERLILTGAYYKQRLLVEPAQIVETLQVNAMFVEDQGFKTFTYSLPMSNQSYYDSSSDYSSLTRTPTKRSLLYELSRDQQLSSSNNGTVGELIMVYDLEPTKGAGLVDVQDDYFVHYFTPGGLRPVDKNIYFVLDTSGSMRGTKIEQLRESMLTILENLNPKDNFNILRFASSTSTLFNSTVEANSANIEQAKSLVNDTIKAGGGTHINIALLEAISSLKALPNEDRRAQIILFLTDGKAATNRTTILDNVRSANNGSICIYCLAFGDNADREFLMNLATENCGIFVGIPVNSNAKEELVKAYLQIKDPLLLDVLISYDGDYVNSTSNNRFDQYFAGTEIVVTGRLQNAGILPAQAVRVQAVSQDGNVNFTMKEDAVVIRPKDTEKIDNEIYEETLKMIYLLEAYGLTNDNVYKESIEMIAMKNNLVTPFTSYVLSETGTFTGFDDVTKVTEVTDVIGITRVTERNEATSHNCLAVSTKASFLFCAFSIRFFYN